MPLTFFQVTGTLDAIVSDSSTDVDGNPDVQNISATVIFTPSVSQAYSVTDSKVYRLTPIRARTNPSDGALKTVDGHTVALVANAGLGLDALTYKVTFEDVVYNEDPQAVIDSFSFAAPTTSTTINLATVTRI